MFFQLLFIHLFRSFLKYTAATSPLPSTVSPRKLCTQAASMISKLLRLYKRSHGLRQICNVAVYIAHSACTIHLLNLPDKLAKRDVTHGVKHLEEIAEGWLCARRTLGILSVLAKKWRVDLPEEAAAVLSRTDAKFGAFKGDVSSPPSEQPQVPGARRGSQPFLSAAAQQNWPNVSSGMPFSQAGAYFPSTSTTTAGPAQAAYATSTSSAANRPPSSTYTLPPNDSATLRASAHPPAVPTPQNPNLRRQANLSADFPVTTGASPSDMFGGVEQLLRDSQDWAYRDQANLGVGFGNWGGAGGGIGQDGGTGWMEGAQQQQQQLAVNGSGASAAGMYGLVSSAAATGGIPYASMGANGWMDGVSAGGSMGLAGQIVDGAGMGGYNDALMGYNEDEWYQ